MKSSQPNNENPSSTSASSPRDNPCLGNDPTVAALDVFADNGISYLLPYAQFLYAERISNPALEKPISSHSCGTPSTLSVLTDRTNGAVRADWHPGRGHDLDLVRV
jgi:hypothetical protein